MNKTTGVLTDDWWNDSDKIPIGTENLERPSQWAGLLGNVLLQLSVAIGHVRFSYVSAILLLVGQAAYVAAIASAVFYEYVNGSITFSKKGLRSWRLRLYLVTIMVLIVVFPLLITRGLHAGVLERILICLVTAVVAVIIASAGLFMTYRREIRRMRMQMLIMSTVSD